MIRYPECDRVAGLHHDEVTMPQVGDCNSSGSGQLFHTHLHRRDRQALGLDSQYAGQDYRDLLSDYEMQMSMSRKGDCWDNAVMASFFSTLRKELVHHRRYQTREEAKRDIFDYIEIFYNRQRLHSSLGYLTPVEYENLIAARQAV